MERMDHLRVDDYLEKLASPDFPGPASGTAAATVAAMAAALLEMSIKVTTKKDGEKMPVSSTRIEAVRKQCLALATEDMKTLSELVKATKSKAEFPDAYEESMKNATEPLVSIVKHCEIILSGIEQTIHLANKRVLGELAGSANMAETAAASAKHGVEINLSLMQDISYIEEVRATVNKSYQTSTERKQRIVRIISGS